MKLLKCLIILFVSFSLSSVAQAVTPEPIGAAVKIKNDVRAEFDSRRRDLSTGDNVHQDEVIAVGAASIGELELDDDTKLALGPGARLKLDKFVYNGEKSAGNILVDLVQGTFRFVTGAAAKRSYRIRTPSASITVRGTIFDVYVADDGMVWLLLLEGGVTACNDRGDCRDLNRPGLIIHVTPDGEVSDPMRWAALPGRDIIGFNSAFPFVVNAPQIDPVRLLTRDSIIKNAAVEPQSTPPKKKKKVKKKPKKKYVKRKPITKKKPIRKVRIKPKKRKKKKWVKKNNQGDKLLNAAIGIGIGIAASKLLKKKKRRPGKPYPGKPCRHGKYC